MRSGQHADTTPDGSPIPTAERVAALLRDRIVEGDLPSGTPLRETALAADLEVSRNTLREGLRLLAAQGLVAQRLYRGAVVDTMTTRRVRDLYTTRRAIELHAVEESGLASAAAFEALETTVNAAEQAMVRKQWRDAGTASLRFHQAVVGLLASGVLDQFFAHVVAQLRLAFGTVMDADSFQVPWVEQDRKIAELLYAGRRLEAQVLLRSYLDTSECWVLDVVRLAERPQPANRRQRRRATATLGGSR